VANLLVVMNLPGWFETLQCVPVGFAATLKMQHITC